MKRRIALISEHASPLAELGGVDSGGQNVYVAQVAKRLAANGDQVDVFTRRDSLDQPEVVRWENGVRIIHVPAGPAQHIPKEQLLPYMADFTAFLVKWCKRRRPYDLIHANFWTSGLVAADVKAATGIPFVVTFHALGRVRRMHQKEHDGFPDERFAIEERVIAEADAVIAECPQEQEDLIVLYKTDPAKVTIVPCGFDGQELWPVPKHLARARLGLPDERIILQLGRMVPRKGIDTVIRGFAKMVREDDTPARLLVVGGATGEPGGRSSPELERLQFLACSEGVGDRVQFTGPSSREALKYYFSAADVFVTMPWYEPFGITPLEAMACGTPVIGANVGGIKFSVRDGETGYLVAPHDHEFLAERLAHLYRHPHLLTSFAQQGIRRVNDLFTWAHVAEMLSAVYEGVLDGKRRAASGRSEDMTVIDTGFDDAIEAMRDSRQSLAHEVIEAANLLSGSFARHGKVLLCGNGGSAADAQHFATELVGRFKDDRRRALPAIALNSDTTMLTAWSNDFSFDGVFARQVEALGSPGDVLIAISTSGESTNVLRALEEARSRGLRSIALLGRDGGAARRLADVSLVVPSRDTQHIQEVHIVLIHLICDLVERRVSCQPAVTPANAVGPTDLRQAPKLVEVTA
jgi:phosphoheptose isomerase